MSPGGLQVASICRLPASATCFGATISLEATNTGCVAQWMGELPVDLIRFAALPTARWTQISKLDF